LLALGGFAFAVRYAALEQVFPVKPLGDEVYYAVVASNIANGRGHVYTENARALRPPAQAYLLSWVVQPDRPVRWPEGPGRPLLDVEALRPILNLQVAVGTLLVLATALLGRALFDPRTGFVAGLLAALYPTFIAYSHYLYSETLFAALVTTGLAGVALGARRGGLGLAAVTGLVFGVATLTREVALPVAGVGVLWWVLEAGPGGRRAAAARGAVLLACAVLVVLPWTLRNHALLGRVIPVSTIGWMAAAEGNSLVGARWLQPSPPGRGEFRRAYLEVEGEVERADFAREATFERIRALGPLWPAVKLVRNVPLMLSPDAFSFYKIRRGSYGDVAPSTRAWLHIATTGSYALVFLAGVVGLAGAAAGGRRSLGLLVLAVVLSVHVFANANSRFRMPWMPLFAVFASYALLGGRAAWQRLSPWARVASAGIGLVFLGICASYYALGLYA
jgi:4-amino-4-deoxy-L-arabinose transferase-like glycosyltransferase